MQIIFLFVAFFTNNIINCISVSVIGIGRYEKYYIGILSVSADMKIGVIGGYWYRQICKKPYRLYTEARYNY